MLMAIGEPSIVRSAISTRRLLPQSRIGDGKIPLSHGKLHINRWWTPVFAAPCPTGGLAKHNYENEEAGK
jgi:hypothetical protein